MKSLSLFLIENTVFGLQILFMMIFSLQLQKILFLEYHTEKQKKIIRTIEFGSTCLYILAMVPTIFINTPFLDFYSNIVLTVFLITWAILIILGAFWGRKRAKWLCILEFLPALGYYQCFQAVLDIIYNFITEKKNLFVADFSMMFFYALLLLAFFLLKKKDIKFLKDLEKDIQYRSLSIFEEIFVWLVGIWMVIDAPNVTQDTSDPNFVYITFLNFVFVVIVVIFVISSNYRDYYSKKNKALQKSLITTMADLVESRDENTGGHIHRTSKYVEIIARQLQKENKFPKILTEDYIEHMIIAAPLHDVGKIHIPDAILNKPGKLDDNEYAVMKTHTEKGSDIINHVEESTGNMDYLSIAKEMATYHHERMDGKGYPYGIGGDEIPLCAKILAVADVFDALASKRCYKSPMPLDQAFAIIEEEAGDHFDTEVVKAFLSCREEIESIVAAYNT